jgi:hypothetical protein
MARIYAAPDSPWRARLPYILVVVFLAAVAIIFATRALGVWGGASVLSDPNAVSVTYTTEAGEGSTQGVVNSPLVVSVKIPWSTGGQDTVLSGVALVLLDEAGNPATFGSAPATEGFPLKPTFDVSVWEWRGSVPSLPGKYHPGLRIEALYNKERSSDQVLETPLLDAIAEPGAPLTSGFVFAQDSNLWLLSTDVSKQRRITYFPEFYEYADKPTWSPDGKRIAFTYSPRTEAGDLPFTDIWQVNPDGTDPKPLATHQEGESLLDPSYSPDGKYVYFTVDTSASLSTPDSTAIMGANTRIDRLELATGARTQWMPRAQMPSSDGPGGETVYLELVPPRNSTEGLIAPPQRLMRSAPDGDSPAQVLDQSAFQDMYAPSMSPDGKWIAFAAVNIGPTPGGSRPNPDFLSWLGLAPRPAQAHGLPWDLYLVSSAGGQANRLTKLDEDQPYTAWLDNSTIAFMGTSGMYKLGIDPSGKPLEKPQKLHQGAPHGGLSWHAP